MDSQDWSNPLNDCDIWKICVLTPYALLLVFDENMDNFLAQIAFKQHFCTDQAAIFLESIFGSVSDSDWTCCIWSLMVNNFEVAAMNFNPLATYVRERQGKRVIRKAWTLNWLGKLLLWFRVCCRKTLTKIPESWLFQHENMWVQCLFESDM